jgi:hypothetical protein
LSAEWVQQIVIRAETIRLHASPSEVRSFVLEYKVSSTGFARAEHTASRSNEVNHAEGAALEELSVLPVRSFSLELCGGAKRLNQRNQRAQGVMDGKLC